MFAVPEDFEHALDEMGSVIDVTVSDLIVITDKARKHAQMRRAESLRVRTLMTHPVHTVTPDAPLSTAAQLLLTHQISGLPWSIISTIWWASSQRRICSPRSASPATVPHRTSGRPSKGCFTPDPVA
ncbi:MAG: CBS domain-containing protein [Chromatiaceae bacterium]|nr:CBS domain-containing protein [Chromatiaceae bacterium]